MEVNRAETERYNSHTTWQKLAEFKEDDNAYSKILVAGTYENKKINA